MKRPAPPDTVLAGRFAPAPELHDWLVEHILSTAGALHNPDHAHLDGADIEFMWAPTSFAKRGRIVVGQAEQYSPRTSGWERERSEEQMRDWFGGRVPEYIITLAADYCAACSDAEFCALVEHECYHIAHKTDEFGAPKFKKSGAPELALRGHDVEEFIGVVARYGVGAPDGPVARLVEAASTKPRVSGFSVASACGTCIARAA